MPIADIDEDERPEISHSVNPAKQEHVLVDVLGTESTTGMGSA
jgi:hypothetical protein